MSQNTRALRAGAYQQFENGLSERAMSQVTVPGLARIVALGLADFEQLNEEEERQFIALLYVQLKAFDNAYYQFRLGMFDEDRWQMSLRELTHLLQQPGCVILGETMRSTLSSEFVALVSEILGDQPDRVGGPR